MNILALLSCTVLICALAAACYILWRKVKEQQKQLLQDESLQSLFENQNEAWVIFDAETLMAIRANQKALNLFGVYRVNRLNRLSFKNIFREPLTDDEVQLLYSAIDQEAFSSRKLQCSGTNGRIFNALVSISRVYEGNLFCRFAEEPVRFEFKPVHALPAETHIVEEQTQEVIQPVINVMPPSSVPATQASREMAPVEQDKDIPLPLVWINESQLITMANKAFTEMSGYTQQELLRLHFSDLMHPLPSQGRDLTELTEGKVIYYSDERTLLRKDGRKVIVRCQGMMTRQPGIALIRLEDVTDQKAMERELLYTRDNLQAVVDHTTEAIFAVDALDKITVVNTVYRDRFFEKYGVWLKNGMAYGEALPKEERSGWRKTLTDVLRGKIITSREQFSTSDAMMEHYEVSLHPVFSGIHKLITGASYFARNITSQIAHENELQAAKDVAEKATEAKSRFLATMSHEIRTPLNGLIGMAELLRTTKLNAEQQKFLSTIRVSGDALLQVINEVLDYSRLEADRMKLEAAPLSVEKVIGESVDILSAKALEKDLELEKIIDPSAPVAIMGDKARLRQVLVNLIGNAIKFTERGFVRVIAEGVIKDRQYLKITVEDSGIGMTKEQVSKLFTEYEQAEGTYGRFGGSGLGLTISKRIVELMGGAIAVQSQQGAGSRFYFEIPVEVSHEEIVETVSVKPFEAVHLAETYPLSILVAEDNDVNQLLMVNILKQLGYKADAASNGREVLKKIENADYDLIFMDVQMPEMDGLEATRQIISKYKDQRPYIVSMTGFAADEDRQQCLDAGMDDYISKPIFIEDIERMIKKWPARMKKTTTTKAPSPEISIDGAFEKFTLLDTAAVQRLRDIAAKTDASFVNQVITLFERQVPTGIYDIEEASTAGDLGKLWQTAHKLKGTCVNVGALRLAELFRTLEVKGKNGDQRQMSSYVEALRPLYENTLLAFRRELSGGVQD